MPICYQFIEKATGKVMLLNDIDKMLCDATGQEYSEKSYCYAFQWITNAVVRLTKETGKCTEAAFDEWAKEIELTPEEIAIARRFLLDEYEFHGWYQRH